MATLIRATCSDCGDVELGTRDLVVRLCEDTESGTYVFRCPDCTHPSSDAADRPTIDLLVSSGCRLELWSIPAELVEDRARRRAASPTTTSSTSTRSSTSPTGTASSSPPTSET